MRYSTAFYFDIWSSDNLHTFQLFLSTGILISYNFVYSNTILIFTTLKKGNEVNLVHIFQPFFHPFWSYVNKTISWGPNALSFMFRQEGSLEPVWLSGNHLVYPYQIQIHPGLHHLQHRVQLHLNVYQAILYFLNKIESLSNWL